MRTKNFLNMMAMMFERCGVNKGLLPVKGRDGVTYYVGPSSPGNSSGWPYSGTYTVQSSATSAGLCIGSGTTAATEDDYDLAAQIMSGFSSSTVANASLDNDGNPTVTFDLTITNTGSSAITVAEVGMKQMLYTTTAENGTSFSTRLFLLDRTVLSEPVTIAAGEYAVIRYILKTDIT